MNESITRLFVEQPLALPRSAKKVGSLKLLSLTPVTFFTFSCLWAFSQSEVWSPSGVYHTPSAAVSGYTGSVNQWYVLLTNSVDH